MNRTRKYKLRYVALVVIASAAVAGIVIGYDLDAMGLLVAAVVFVVPPRIAGVFLRDLFASRRDVSAGRFEEGKASAERFLDTLDREPWRRHLIYFFFGIYTWSTRAMALTNLGAAEMGLGDLDAAEARFHEALQADPQTPLPYHNLAIVAAARGDDELAGQMLAKAKELGYERTIPDKIISSVGGAYARYQSLPR